MPFSSKPVLSNYLCNAKGEMFWFYAQVKPCWTNYLCGFLFTYSSLVVSLNWKGLIRETGVNGGVHLGNGCKETHLGKYWYSNRDTFEYLQTVDGSAIESTQFPDWLASFNYILYFPVHFHLTRLISSAKNVAVFQQIALGFLSHPLFAIESLLI